MWCHNYIQAPQASGVSEDERSISGSHNPFIYLCDVCGCDKLGLCGVALFYSSNCHNQMKQLNFTAVAPVTVPVQKVGERIFSWRTVAKVFNSLPLGICECESEEDAKGYLKALLLLSCFILSVLEG